METSPWNLGGLTLRELAARVWAECWADEVTDRAAALSYYFLFALFPALLFLTALVGFLPIEGLMDQFMANFGRVLPADAISVIQKTLQEIVSGSRASLLSLGILAALWAASNGMDSAMTTLNVAYDVDDPRPWWKRRLIAVGLTFGFALFILSASILMVFGPRLGGALTDRLGYGKLFAVLWNVASLPLVISFVLIGVAFVYYFAPAARQRLRWVTPGSVLATALWMAMSFGLRHYVTYFGNYNTTYGSIGGVILLMLWLYLTSVAILLGAEVNSEIEHAAARRGDPTAKAPGERKPERKAA